MFKQILRTSDLRKVVGLNRCLRDVSSSSSYPSSAFEELDNRVRKRISSRERSIDSTELDNLKEFRRSTLDRISRLAYQDDHLIRSVHSCNCIQRLLALVEQHLAAVSSTGDADDAKRQSASKVDLRPDQLEMIYGKFRQLYCEMKFRAEKNFLSEFYQTLNSLSGFECFLHQTGHLIEQLSTACLIDVFYAFTLILNQEPQSQHVHAVVRQLNARLNSLSLAEIVDCLEIIERYQISPLEDYLAEFDQGYLLRFNRNLVELASRRLVSSQVDSRALPMIIRYFSIFQNPNNDPTYKTRLYLIDALCAADVQIDFEQSVMLMRKIKTNHLFVKENKTRVRYELFIKSMNRLIFKCNSVIFERLSGGTKRKEFNFYLVKIHDFINPINFDFSDFYDQRLIRVLGEFLTENLDSDQNYLYLAYNMAHNYSKFFSFDERLLKLLYCQCCENEKFLPKIAVSNFYYLFAKYRLPFVDHELLATKLLLNSPDHHLGTMDYYKTNPLKILCQLILNDVTDERLLIYFGEAINKLDRAFYKQITFNQYKELALTKAHLNLSRMNIDLRAQILSKLERIVQQISMTRRRPNISYVFIKMNSKLQSNAFLSNGVFINPVAIYDRSIEDLITLNGHESFFEEFDRIPLTGNQEIVTFLESNRLKGNSSNFELNYNYQLKQLLNGLKIKTVDVFIEDFKNLSPARLIDFYVKKALDSYKSPPVRS